MGVIRFWIVCVTLKQSPDRSWAEDELVLHL